MADDPINLAERRAVAAGDSALWTPLDALECALRMVKDGEWKPKHLMVLMVQEGDDHCDVNIVRAGGSWSDFLALLEHAKLDMMEDWRG